MQNENNDGARTKHFLLNLLLCEFDEDSIINSSFSSDTKHLWACKDLKRSSKDRSEL